MCTLHDMWCSCGEWDSHSESYVADLERYAKGLMAELRMCGWTEPVAELDEAPPLQVETRARELHQEEWPGDDWATLNANSRNSWRKAAAESPADSSGVQG